MLRRTPRALKMAKAKGSRGRSRSNASGPPPSTAGPRADPTGKGVRSTNTARSFLSSMLAGLSGPEKLKVLAEFTGLDLAHSGSPGQAVARMRPRDARELCGLLAGDRYRGVVARALDSSPSLNGRSSAMKALVDAATGRDNAAEEVEALLPVAPSMSEAVKSGSCFVVTPRLEAIFGHWPPARAFVSQGIAGTSAS